MTDGTDRPNNPQPDPENWSGGGNGSGGYGYPSAPGAGAPGAGGGYGYPQAPVPGGYGYPQPGQPNPYQQDPQDGSFTPEQQPGPQPGAAFTPTPQPDWQALADRSASSRRTRRRLIVIGAAVAACAVAAAATLWLTNDSGGTGPKPGPVAEGSQSPSPSASEPAWDDPHTVPGQANLLRDRTGSTNIALGPQAEQGSGTKRGEVHFKDNPNSYAQGAGQAVDTTKSFSVAARVYTSAKSGTRIAVSQGDGVSYSFELGHEAVNGKNAWIFRVQSGSGGAEATTAQVASDGLKTASAWAMLTGTYDATTKTIKLYVDGKQAGEVPVAAGIWAAPGPIQLGRARHHDIWAGAWTGAMDNVRVWDSALTAAQVATVKGGKSEVKPTHSWLIS
ncbi:LamG domain-containing protein [Streptomyces sp. G-G2]|uniref:LamG domain-containing protein n=1 Tax=Streptomyces sp. G-G2 TaxID=3046201 RepID=UPI0024B8E57F|nr:LamG domain-containing protein [Streptomyces sp. G-G2]MDJ0384915.1 LamG domain-containing protein [Streptomyces sp. G-G2]